MVALRTPMPNETASVVMAIASRSRRDPSRLAIRPVAAAPSTNAPSDVRQAGAENPDAPAAAKPSSTTLPVMFAVKT